MLTGRILDHLGLFNGILYLCLAAWSAQRIFKQRACLHIAQVLNVLHMWVDASAPVGRGGMRRSYSLHPQRTLPICRYNVAQRPHTRLVCVQRNPAVVLYECSGLAMIVTAFNVRYYCLGKSLTWAYNDSYKFSEFATGFVVFSITGGKLNVPRLPPAPT